MLRALHFLHYLLYYIFNRGRYAYLGFPPRIIKPLKIEGKRNISIGKGTVIERGGWLAAVPADNSSITKLVIGKECRIGHFNHIYATRSIIIENKVLTADKVYISDNLHEYRDTSIAIMEQPIIQLPPVSIGEGSWLGENTCVMASIGKHCVIGANSVVTHPIPDYCVAVGAPAKIIKRFNINRGVWEPIND